MEIFIKSHNASGTDLDLEVDLGEENDDGDLGFEMRGSVIYCRHCPGQFDNLCTLAQHACPGNAGDALNHHSILDVLMGDDDKPSDPYHVEGYNALPFMQPSVDDSAFQCLDMNWPKQEIPALPRASNATKQEPVTDYEDEEEEPLIPAEAFLEPSNLCTVLNEDWLCALDVRVHVSPYVDEKTKLPINKKRYPCRLCGKSFSRSFHRTRHMLSHTGEKPYACPICQKRFTQSGSVKAHMVTHTKEKLFACELCGKRFALMDTVKRHMKIHTGERPYHCKVCGKRFGHSSHLKRHLLIHFGYKVFSCNICKKKFPDAGILKLHKMNHTDGDMFSCEFCDRKFKTPYSLKRHIESHNVEQTPE